MKKSTIAAAATAIAIAMIVPFGLAQTPLGSGTASPTASTRDYEAGPGMMGGYGPQSNLDLSAEQRGKSWRNGCMWGK